MVTYAYVHLNPTYLSRARARAWLLVYCTYGYLVIGYKTAAWKAINLWSIESIVTRVCTKNQEKDSPHEVSNLWLNQRRPHSTVSCLLQSCLHHLKMAYSTRRQIKCITGTDMTSDYEESGCCCSQRWIIVVSKQQFNNNNNEWMTLMKLDDSRWSQVRHGLHT